jgi:esterase/lipase superfamily enzyme
MVSLTLNVSTGLSQPADETILADPLFAKSDISLADLQAGLEDPSRCNDLIRLHFTRAKGLSEKEQRQFLSDALQHSSWEVRQQAVQQLQRLGMLQDVIRAKVTSFGPNLAFSFKSALVRSVPLPIPAEAMTDEAVESLLKDISSQTDDTAFAAQSQLERLGLSAIPGLLQALTDEDLASVAASALGHVVRQAGVDARAQESNVQTREVMPRPKAPMARAKVQMGTVKQGEPLTLVRRLSDDLPVDVQVFFGTNRQLLAPDAKSNTRLVTGAVLVSLAVLACLLSVVHMIYRANDKRIGCWPSVMLAMLVLLAIVGLYQFNSAWLEKYALNEGVQFGNRRSQTAEMSYGSCHVSIPPTHQIGRVERPTVGAENDEFHVVVKSTEVLQDEIFFNTVKDLLASQSTKGECFVFVHGYNVVFEDAARRTAQIHYDMRFSGVPMFFSWPSRGSFHQYFSDRNEILVSHRFIKQFLIDVAHRSKAKRIHVIAHSMGADATCRAIADLNQQGQVFEQIVLAAPDIDTAYFEGDLLPEILPKAKRTTLYCSKNDWALYASDRFNDGPRAGDSSDQVIVADGLDTIDASDMDTELLGHSYYGSCMPLIDDLRTLLKENLPPQERRLIAQETNRKIPYWMFNLSGVSNGSADSQGINANGGEGADVAE